MTEFRNQRRRFLQLASASAISGAAMTGPIAAFPAMPAASGAILRDEGIILEFDALMRLRVSRPRADAGGSVALTRFGAADYLLLPGGVRLDEFELATVKHAAIEGPYGPGEGLTLAGLARSGRVAGIGAPSLEKSIEVSLFRRYPAFAIYRVTYRNLGTRPIAVSGWVSRDLELQASSSAAASEPPFWSYCGSTHSDRRDWVQPLKAGFSQENFFGMEASDYGGGTPIVDVWRRDAGIAIGHLETRPRLLSIPLKRTVGGARLAMRAEIKSTLAPGESLATPRGFIATHAGDYFGTLDTYRRVMGEIGLCAPPPPAEAYEPIWCAWGYERECSPQLIVATLPKVQDLKLKWVVVDDGWQSNVGDWQLDRAKYPQGDAQMRELVAAIRARDLRPRLWFAPLAAAPGSDLLHDHTDMLLLDKDGAVQNVSWWNSFYLCPAYPPTLEYTKALVEKFFAAWGYAGLKIDGQHLNAVPPCYNPAHRHARPEESTERLQDFFQEMYATAAAIEPHAVMELCPCGTSYSFFNFAAMNQAPASDPESSWQVRHKGKTLKALMGPSAAFAGDHVELSDGGADFASTVGIGAIVSTKFTWPADPKPKDSFLLTPEREAIWRKWISLYSEKMLPKGKYRGELYDIGFDKPETHAIEQRGRMYFALYAKQWNGEVELRGLPPGACAVFDYVTGRELGRLEPTHRRIAVAFEHALLLEAIPV